MAKTVTSTFLSRTPGLEPVPDGPVRPWNCVCRWLRLLRLALIAFFSITGALTGNASVNITVASGGAGISADTASSASSPGWTSLGAVTIAEQATADFAAGTDVTLILKAPAGFQFNTSLTPSVSFVSDRDITTASVAMTDSSTITITLTVSGTTVADSLSIGDTTAIQVQPIAGSPLARGDITLAATSTEVVDGLTAGTTSLGALTEVAGTAAQLAFVTQPDHARIGSAFATQPVVRTQDAYGNESTVGLGSTVPVTIAIKTGTGTLQGTTVYDIGASAGNGTITASDLSIDQTGAFTLSAVANSLAEADSRLFSVMLPEVAPAGWYSGDMHVHRSCGGSPEATSSIYDTMVGQDLSVVSLLADMGNGEVQDPATDLPLVNGSDDPVSTPGRIVHWDAEWHWDPTYLQYPHQALGGHIVALGLTHAEQIWNEMSSSIFDWAHQQGGIAGFAHFEYLSQNQDADGFPAALTCCTPIEYPVEVALGACDFVSEDALNVPGQDYCISAYYRLLNCGFRPGLAAGSDYPCGPAIGPILTYCQVAGGQLTYRNWIQAIAAGRTVVSLDGRNEFVNLVVNGTATPGDEVQLSGAGSVPVSVTWTANQDLGGTVELVCNGQVVLSQPASVTASTPVTLSTNVYFSHSGWLCARRMGSNGHVVHTAAVFVIVDGKPVRVSAADAQFYVQWIDKLLANTSSGGAWNSYFPTQLADAQARYIQARNVYAQRASEVPLTVETSSLPSGLQNLPYTGTLEASGGTSPYATWSVVTGTLPPGLTLDTSTGTISGTPTATGVFNFVVIVTDNSTPEPQVATLPLSITIMDIYPQVADAPILVLANAANPFSIYYAEILLAEGLNEFGLKDISSVNSDMLADYDVILLGETALTDAQVTMLSDWVSAGGSLIAMRPDKKLADLLGLSDAGSTLDNAYLLVNTASAPGMGIVGQTMQFHGTADQYTLASAPPVATPLATLYTTSETPAGDGNPAVTLRSVGSGQAAAFTFDLARSVVYTRQGNPAWSGQPRDGSLDQTVDGEPGVLRSVDLFYGAASFDPQPDWVDFDKVAIPQADEQQRLLANLMIHMEASKKPLPRFWYFPHGYKAVVVMTGDDHAGAYGGSYATTRFDDYLAASSPEGSVDDWTVPRCTAYIFDSPNPCLTSDAQAKLYSDAGFEIALHLNTDCADYTAPSLDAFYADQMGQFTTLYPSLPPQTTHRIHCIAWSEYSIPAIVSRAHGIRLDTSYYYWPAAWVQDRPGLFTGSGMPMRFATSEGDVLDIYQAATQMTDESGQTYPYTVDTLLDRALGAEGYYGAFVANVHTDTYPEQQADAIFSSAQSRGVPIISARQLLTWLDARNSSSFSSITWSNGKETFSLQASASARGLQAMVPVSVGSTVSGVTSNGIPIAYNMTWIKGMMYAVFPAATGTYQTSFAVDTTPPSVTATLPADGASGVGLVTNVSVTFSEPMDPTTITTDTITLRDPLGSLVPATITYNPATLTAVLTPASLLALASTYTAIVKGGAAGGVTDVAGNPLANDTLWSFATASQFPSNIWPSTAVPGLPQGDSDDQPVELGVKFRSAVDGRITGIRFYKATSNTGTHVGNLWTTNGDLLATATFANETESGWQQVIFSTPVAISANTVYVASYHTDTGHYCADAGYFSEHSQDNYPLHALADGESGGNGVYSYGASSSFPDQTWLAANYWVDVVFVSPVLTVTANSGQTKLYGQPDPILTYQASGFLEGDTAESVLTGALDRAAGETVGSYTINEGSLSAGGRLHNYFCPGGLYDYTGCGDHQFGDHGDNKVYDGDTSATISSDNVVLSGILEADVGLVDLSTNGYVATFDSADAGAGFWVTVSGLSLTGAKAGQYVLTQPEGLTAAIEKATPTATLAVDNTPVTYDGNAQAATVGITANSVPGSVANILTGGAASQTGAGTYGVTADFVPTDSANYNSLIGQPAGDFVIQKATPTATLAVDNTPVTYDGNAQAATVGITANSVPGSVANILTGGAASQTGAGTYGVTADFVPTDSANYNSLIGQPAGEFVIQKATPTATLAVDNTPVTYDGTAQSATVGITASSVPGSVANILTGGAASQTGAGTYAVTADFMPTDSANYNSLIGQSAGDFVIQQAAVTITSGITADNKVYDGGTSATISSNNVVLNGVLGADAAQVDLSTNGYMATFDNAGPGDNLGVTVTGLSLAGAKAEDYTLTAPAGLTAKIGKAAVAITSGITADSKVYDGGSSATISSNNVVLSGISAADLGDVDLSTNGYVATFDSADAGAGIGVTVSGLSLTGAKAGQYVLTQPEGLTAAIEKATPTATLAVDNTPVTYDGTAQSATVGITVSSVPGTVATILTGGAANQTDAATYAVTADFVPTDSANYNSLIGQPAGEFVIQKATPTATLAVDNTPVTYDGNAQAATVGITANSVPGSVANILTGGAASQTGAGTYGVTADFVPTDSANYNSLIGQPAGEFVIQKATPTATLAVDNTPVTYDGTAQSATVGITASSVPGSVANILTGGAASQTGAGTYGVTADFVPTDSANYTSLIGQSVGDFAIQKAAVTITSGITADNKVYDGDTGTTISSDNVVLSGLLEADAGLVDLSTNGYVATFDDAGPGDNIGVTVDGLSLTGDKAGDYTLIQPTLTANIAAKELTVSGAAVASKVYDGTTDAAISGATLVGVVGTEDVSLADTTSGTFNDKNIGEGKAVTTAMTLVGADIGNYTLTQPALTGDITAKELTVTGAAVTPKEYDGNADAAITGATLDGVVGTEEVTLANAGAGTFGDKNIGLGKAVTTAMTLAGADEGNYTLTQPALTGDITAKELTVTGAAVTPKEYDGNADAAITGATLDGVVGTEEVTLANAGAGTFGDKNIGLGKAVTTAMTLAGTDEGNYTLTQPTLTGDITAKGLVVTGAAVTPKEYDGNAEAAITGATLDGVVGTEDVTLANAGTGTFNDKNMGLGKAVASAMTLAGADNGDYTLIQPALTGDITAKELTVTGITASNKTYDGNTTATLDTAGAVLEGAVTGDDVTLDTSAAVGEFSDPEIGTDKTVQVSRLILNGQDAGNYTLIQPVTTANITPNSVAVSGTVAYYTNSASVGNVTMSLTGDTTLTTNTLADGSYGLTSIPAGGTYCVTPSKADDSPPAHGVNVLDLLAIQKHIAAVASLDSPYKLLAADVNGDHKINVLDLLAIQKLIAAVTNSLPAGLWRFVPADYSFANPQAPWDGPTNRWYTNVVADVTNGDFVAIKLGDVNNSWTAPVGQSLLAKSAQGQQALGQNVLPEVVFAVSRQSAQPGQTVAARVTVSGFDQVSGAQFSLAWDPAVLRYVGTGSYGVRGLSAGSFGTTLVASGRLGFVWFDPAAVGVTMAGGTVLFTVSFEVIGHAGSVSTVALTGSPTEQAVCVGDALAPFGAQDGSIAVVGPGVLVSNPAYAHGVFRLSVPTEKGRSYVLEFTDALTPANWTALPAVAGDGMVTILVDPTATNQQRFYRVHVQ